MGSIAGAGPFWVDTGRMVTDMKKLILVLILALTPGLSFAGSQEIRSVVGMAKAVASCTTPQTYDELNEGFLGADYENTWTATANGATINPDKTLTVGGGIPTGACTEGLNIVSTAQLPTTVWNRGSAIDVATVNIDTYVSVLIHAVSIDDYSNSSILTLGALPDPTNQLAWSLQVRRAGAVYQLQVLNIVGTRVAIALDTWYTIKIHTFKLSVEVLRPATLRENVRLRQWIPTMPNTWHSRAEP